MTIEQKYQRWKALGRSLRKLGMDTLRETSEDYLNKQREQMLSGLNSQGEPIGEYSSKIYGDSKLQRNPRAGGNVDLYDEGDFQRELTLRPQGERKFLMYSQDWKNDMLVERYGATIFLLSPKFLAEYRQNSFSKPFKTKVNEFQRATS